MKKIFSAGCALLATLLFCAHSRHSGKQLPELPPPHLSLVLAPLDSRPVCGEMPQELGKLAGITVILPPKELLDNYKLPADTKKLFAWLKQSLPTADAGIISTDLFIHGGLLHGRQNKLSEEEYTNALNILEQTLLPAAAKDVAVFSVIPRLLVSDELLPDRWYQYQLLRYSKFFDMAELFGDYLITEQLQDSIAKIPPPILTKYAKLYQSNYFLNQRLLERKLPHHTVCIGQDDGAPFGLPHRSAQQLETLIAASDKDKLYLTYGADELASLLLTRFYLRTSRYRPKILLKYADTSVEFLHMPYMPASIGEVLRNQLTLLEIYEAASTADADIICYISCGNERYKPSLKQEEELRSLAATGKSLALLDLSENFSTEELLLPLLLQKNFPLTKLSSFSGWNTFSNSSGSLLSQAIIFSGQANRLPFEMLPTLYAENLRFTCKRILEDYFYQKVCHPELRETLLRAGSDPADLEEQERLEVERELQGKIAWECEKLLWQNLSREPFYTQGKTNYYLSDLRAGVYLPWNRIFEIGLQIYTETEVKKATDF